MGGRYHLFAYEQRLFISVHDIDWFSRCIVCFGMAFPHTEPLAHQKNENVVIDELVLATTIYAQAIYGLGEVMAEMRGKRTHQGQHN